MKHKAGIISVLTAAFLSLLVFSAGTAFCEDTFEIKRIGNIHPYADNAFRIRSNEAGTLEIRIHDGFCVYRTISREIPQGETMVHWDGCGYNREKLYEKTYTITADLTTQTGDVYSVSFDSPVEYALQCLQYALTSSDTLYLDSPESWFLEYRTVTDGKVVIEIRSKEHPNEVYS